MLLALMLCYAGFTALCLAMPRHHDELLGGKPSLRRRQGLTGAGWSLLGLSLWVTVADRGWGFGLVDWFAVLMCSALALVLLLPYQPRLAMALGLVSVFVSPVAAWAVN